MVGMGFPHYTAPETSRRARSSRAEPEHTSKKGSYLVEILVADALQGRNPILHFFPRLGAQDDPPEGRDNLSARCPHTFIEYRRNTRAPFVN